jgi:uncharacterized membrane protein
LWETKPMPDRVWYYASGGQRHGPVKTAELKRLATAGELRPTDLVWTDTLANWAPASTVKGLLPAEQGTQTAAQAPAAPEADVPAPVVIEQRESSDTTEPSPAASVVARRAGLEVAAALRQLIADPWGRVATVYEQLGPKRAMFVGAAFIAAFFLSALLAMVLRDAVLLPGVALLDSTDTAAFVKTLITLVGYLGALLGAVMLFRVATRTGAAFAADVFVVGAALLPLAAFAIIDGLLNPLSPVVQWVKSVLFLFFAVTAILMLYNGLSKAVRLSDRIAALAVPAVLAAAMTVALILRWLLAKLPM